MLTVQVFPVPAKEDKIKFYDYSLYSITIRDRIWSIKANIEGTKFAIGTSGNDTLPLQIFDIEKYV